MTSNRKSALEGRITGNGSPSPSKAEKQPAARFGRLLITLTAAAMMLMPANSLYAQVTVGSADSPQPFSVLELIGDGTKGLRLPQMSEAKRDEMTATAEFTAEKIKKALGLQIFNTTTRCVNTWNGNMWIEICPPEGQYVPPTLYTCLKVSNEGKTFEAFEDPNATAYEFYLGDVSLGQQPGRFYTFATAPQNPATVTVAYIYSPTFLKPTMISVAGGSFMMGSELQHDPTDLGGNTVIPPVRQVTVSSFKMSDAPITQAQYAAIMGGNPSKSRPLEDNNCNPLLAPWSDRPIEDVNWFDAIIICNKLSVKDGRTPCYSINGLYTAMDLVGFSYQDDRIPGKYVGHPDIDKWDNDVVCDWSANGYRLPTEAEWEYAARGGQLSLYNTSGGTDMDYYSAGSNNTDEVAWYGVDYDGSIGNNGGIVQPVKKKKPNALGLYDMSGNVEEWCWDWYDNYPSVAETDPKGPATKPVNGSRVKRGYYNNHRHYCRVTLRSWYTSSHRLDKFSLRVVLQE